MRKDKKYTMPEIELMKFKLKLQDMVIEKKSTEEIVDFINRWDRQNERKITILNVVRFYINKKIKEGKLIKKDDFSEYNKILIKHFENVERSKIIHNNLSEELIDKLEEVIRVVIKKQQIENVERSKIIHNNLSEELIDKLEEAINKFKEEINKFKEEINKFDEVIKVVIKKQQMLVMLEFAYGEFPYKKNKFLIDTYEKIFRKTFQEIIKELVNINFNTEKEYKTEIMRIIQDNEYNLNAELNAIKSSCEYQLVIIFLTICDGIARLPKRDRKLIYEQKRKFLRNKEKAIEARKKIGLEPDKELINLEYNNPEDFGSYTYEKALKHYKEMLYSNLIKYCRTSQQKAKTISELLEYL